MADLLSKVADRKIMPAYVSKLLAAVKPAEKGANKLSLSLSPPFSEPLSERELEILQLIAQGILQPRDQQATFPGAEHHQRVQPQNL